jgi:hypothetical protein
MSDQYGLRAHNRRIGNPHTTFHTPFYYKAQKVVQGFFRLIKFLFTTAVLTAVVFGIWFGTLALGELVASWAK